MIVVGDGAVVRCGYALDGDENGWEKNYGNNQDNGNGCDNSNDDDYNVTRMKCFNTSSDGPFNEGKRQRVNLGLCWTWT